MKNQIYNVPLIPPDLRKEETIHQIADALDYVDKIATEIFSRITTRVGDNKRRLQAINQRISLAQAKIDKLKGSNKATKVFCSAKYPGTDRFEFHQSVYANETELSELKRSSAPKITAKHANIDDRALKEKLQFYNLRWTVSRHEQDRVKEEGLGQLPKDMKSISSLLLFNTAENPYKKYVLLDPLRAVAKTRKALEPDEDDGMGAAPLSILQREQLDQHVGENYMYSPGLGNVPEIDVPLNLPDLPSFADDLKYIADIGPAIAPSVPASSLPPLPAVIPELPSPGTLDFQPPPSSTPSAPPPPPPAPSLPPAAPPPPPPPEMTLPVAIAPAQAPPPPPPPPIDDSQVSSKKTVVEAVPPQVAVAGDARANLLESIRQAGGKPKLRSVQDRKIEAKKKKQEEKVSGGGGDLMTDLFAKLSMRRKGISGAVRTGSASESSSEVPSGGAKSAMDRISAMIPAPPKPSQPEVQSEDDWD